MVLTFPFHKLFHSPNLLDSLFHDVDRTLQEFVLKFGKLFFLVSAFQLCRLHLLSESPYPVVSCVQLKDEKMTQMKAFYKLGCHLPLADEFSALPWVLHLLALVDQT